MTRNVRRVTAVAGDRNNENGDENSKDDDDDILTIHTSKLFDSRNKTFITDASIKVCRKTGLITDVSRRQTEPTSSNGSNNNELDLRGHTVLPGLVDAHTHIMLHPYAETPSLNQERDESLVERILRATNHCRAALLAGYTTYRDLGTESGSDADIGIRDAINRGLVPGPRLFVATEALASSGGYDVRHENRIGGSVAPRLSDPCDGVTGCRAAVRRRLGAGADVIKFYADYRKRALRFPAQAWKGALPIRFPPTGPMNGPLERNPALLLFGQDEMDAIVSEAKAARAPVAAHAITPEGVVMAAKAGVTSVEHGFYPSHDAKVALKENGTIFVPTLAVLEAEKAAIPDSLFEEVLRSVKETWVMGVKLATGGDTGAFAHGDNAREIELLVGVGIPLEEVLTMATLHGWEACGGDWCGRRFGSLEKGFAADIIALEGDLTEDLAALRRVKTVIKDGKVVVEQGKIVQ